MSSVSVIHGDCLEQLQKMNDNSIDGILTDPPYGISFMGKKWDYQLPSIEVWKECLRVIKPGGYMIAFGGTRTYHRLACSVEDAGFELRDCIMYCFGSGFPKSLDIGKAIDKEQGNEREIVGSKLGLPGYSLTSTENQGNTLDWSKSNRNGEKECEITKGNTIWEGYGTALKPAYEPAILCRKPIAGTVAKNVLEWGTGGLNIDGCRIGEEVRSNKPVGELTGIGSTRTVPKGIETVVTGRFPANLLHDGSEEVTEQFPYSQGMSGGGAKDKNKKDEWTVQQFNRQLVRYEWIRGDSGSASRFFQVCPIEQEDIETSRIFYTSKVSSKERNAGCDNLPEHPIYTKTNPQPNRDKQEQGTRRNNHPTLKPISLTTYLAKLIKPPTENTTLLVPFSGAGSEMIGGIKAGWDNIIGIEKEENYCNIANARITYWDEPKKKEENQESKPKRIKLF